jgi:hypothetical protein
MANTLQLGNDATLTLTTLTNAVTAAAVTGATVTAQPYKANTSAGGWSAAGDPVTLPHVSAGTYRGTLESSVIDAHFSANAPYLIEFVASGAGDGEWNLRGYVQERGGS